jgi:SAM-dependent methyltransferase
MSRRSHWETIYTSKAESEVSWYREHLETSIELIQKIDLPRTAEILDVGGGTSRLVDDLLSLGYQNLSVLDVSEAALGKAQERLGERAERVRWIAGDITAMQLPSEHYDLWHDRAVFHFLTNPADRSTYAELATSALKRGGSLLVATFALDGPAKCSGLPVERYGPEELAHQFPGFRVVEAQGEIHQTPFGTAQPFTYLLLQKS